MSLTVPRGDLVWVFRRGHPGKLYKSGTIHLDLPDTCEHYSVVVLEKNGSILESKGHTYIAIANGDHFKPSDDKVWEKPEEPSLHQRTFNLHILNTEPGVSWSDATSTDTTYTVIVKADECCIWDPTPTYEKHSTAIINATLEEVQSKCNMQSSADCYGFGRFSLLRSSHSSIATPGAYGILDTADSHITERLWTLHVNLAQQQLGIAKPKSKEQWENLFTLTLTSFGYVMPWTLEQRDNITTELFLGTQQDCEDQSSRVLAVINHLKKTEWSLLNVEKQLYDMCKEITEGYIVSLWADPQVSGSTGITRAGHCVCAIKRNGSFQILEATSPITPHKPGKEYPKMNGVLLNHPRVIEPNRYLKFAFMANEKTSFFVGHYDKDKKFSIGVDDLNSPFEILDFGGKERMLHNTLFKDFTIMPCIDPKANNNLHKALVTFKKLFPHLFCDITASDRTATGAIATKPIGKACRFDLPFITIYVVEQCEPCT